MNVYGVFFTILNKFKMQILENCHIFFFFVLLTYNEKKNFLYQDNSCVVDMIVISTSFLPLCGIYIICMILFKSDIRQKFRADFHYFFLNLILFWTNLKEYIDLKNVQFLFKDAEILCLKFRESFLCAIQEPVSVKSKRSYKFCLCHFIQPYISIKWFVINTKYPKAFSSLYFITKLN